MEPKVSKIKTRMRDMAPAGKPIDNGIYCPVWVSFADTRECRGCDGRKASCSFYQNHLEQRSTYEQREENVA